MIGGGATRGRAPAQAAGPHWAAPHVGSPDWQEAAAEGRGAQKVQTLSSCSPSFPGYQACPVAWSTRSSAGVRRNERAGKSPGLAEKLAAKTAGEMEGKSERPRQGGSTGESTRKVDGTSPASLRYRCPLSTSQLRRTPVCRNQQRTRAGNIMKTACGPRLIFPMSLTYISRTQ